MTTLSRTAVCTAAVICCLGLNTAARGDQLIASGNWGDSSIWNTNDGQPIPDNVYDEYNDRVFVYGNHAVTLDTAYNYDKLSLYIGKNGTAGTLIAPEGTSATFKTCWVCYGHGTLPEAATINITGGSLTAVRGMSGPHGGRWVGYDNSPGTFTLNVSAGMLTVVGGDLALNFGGLSGNVSNISVSGTGIMDLVSVSSGGGTLNWTVGDFGKVIIDGDHTGDPTLGGLLHGADGWGLDAAFDGTETSIWAVPEPAGVVLLASGCVVALLLLGLRRRHRTRFSTGDE